eukprot:657919-Pelagomonas_calceolata.AAC.1
MSWLIRHVSQACQACQHYRQAGFTRNQSLRSARLGHTCAGSMLRIPVFRPQTIPLKLCSLDPFQYIVPREKHPRLYMFDGKAVASSLVGALYLNTRSRTWHASCIWQSSSGRGAARQRKAGGGQSKPAGAWLTTRQIKSFSLVGS